MGEQKPTRSFLILKNQRAGKVRTAMTGEQRAVHFYKNLHYIKERNKRAGKVRTAMTGEQRAVHSSLVLKGTNEQGKYLQP